MAESERAPSTSFEVKLPGSLAEWTSKNSFNNTLLTDVFNGISLLIGDFMSSMSAPASDSAADDSLGYETDRARSAEQSSAPSELDKGKGDTEEKFVEAREIQDEAPLVPTGADQEQSDLEEAVKEKGNALTDRRGFLGEQQQIPKEVPFKNAADGLPEDTPLDFSTDSQSMRTLPKDGGSIFAQRDAEIASLRSDFTGFQTKFENTIASAMASIPGTIAETIAKLLDPLREEQDSLASRLNALSMNYTADEEKARKPVEEEAAKPVEEPEVPPGPAPNVPIFQREAGADEAIPLTNQLSPPQRKVEFGDPLDGLTDRRRVPTSRDV